MTVVVQVSIPYRTNIPEDCCTNTWHFDRLAGGDIDAANAHILFVDIAGFYADAYQSITTGTMAPYANPLLTTMKMFNLEDPMPRTAVLEEVVPLTVAQPASAQIPSEVACVLSYHTEYEGGISKQSQRGRLYLGCITDDWIDAAPSTSFPSVKFLTRENLGIAASSFAAVVLDDEWGWVVYSPTLNQTFAVAGGWVDDAFDTQRRRGQAPTTRTLWFS